MIPIHSGTFVDGSEASKWHSDHLAAAYCLIVSLAILLYDTIITSNQCTVYVWTRKFAVPTFLLLFLQLSSLLATVAAILIFLGPQTDESCESFFLSRWVFTTIALVTNTAFSTIRTWAIGGFNVHLTLLVFAVSLAAPVTSAYSNSTWKILPEVSPLVAPFGGCIYYFTVSDGTRARLVAVIQTSLLATDFLVLVVALVRLLRWRSVLDRASTHPSLSTRLIHSGVIYFAASFATNLAAISVAQTNLVLLSPTLHFHYVFTSIKITRFLTNLRSEERDNTITSTIVGDLGGSLHVAPGERDTISDIIWRPETRRDVYEETKED